MTTEPKTSITPEPETNIVPTKKPRRAKIILMALMTWIVSGLAVDGRWGDLVDAPHSP